MSHRNDSCSLQRSSVLPAPEADDEACRLDDQAEALAQAGRYADAQSLYEQALELLKATVGAEHPDYCNVQGHLAELHLVCGRPGVAETLSREACESLRRLLRDPELNSILDPEIRNSVATIYQQALTHLGTALRAQGEYLEAITNLEEAVQAAHDRFGAESLEIAGAWNNLGVAHKYRGAYDRAQTCYATAQTIHAASPQVDPQARAALLYNVAGLHHARGEYEAAEAPSRAALALLRQHVPADHPDLGVHCMTLGSILSGQQRWREAAEFLERALTIFESAFGEFHPDTAHALNNLAEVRQAGGDRTAAEHMHRRALAIREQVWNENHPDIASSCNNLALLCADRGQWTEASALLERALGILQGVDGLEERLATLNNNYEGLLERIAAR